jgi:hypothetical protein
VFRGEVQHAVTVSCDQQWRLLDAFIVEAPAQLAERAPEEDRPASSNSDFMCPAPRPRSSRSPDNCTVAAMSLASRVGL